MAVRLKAWRLPLIVLTLICGVVAGLRYWRSGSPTLHSLVGRLPAQARTLIYVDLAALRNVGVLGRLVGPVGSAESDYLRFVEESGFDYQRDLHSAVIGLDGETTYLLGVGTFDWGALRKYAETRKGVCRLSVCRLPADSRGRVISWGTLRPDVIALASSADPWAAMTIMDEQSSARSLIQTVDPVWLTTTGKALRNLATLPDGLRTFTRSLESANEILMSVGVTAAGSLELRLVADCPQPEDATRVAAELTQGTATLKSLLARENRRPNPADLSGVLTAGAFRSAGSRVTGTWPVSNKLVETLMAPGA
jgi:hypothetical protein